MNSQSLIIHVVSSIAGQNMSRRGDGQFCEAASGVTVAQSGGFLAFVVRG